MTGVIINGAKGKMGQEAVKAVTADSHLQCLAALDKTDNLEAAIQEHRADVVVDLTHPSSVFENVQCILSNGAHAVVGTTGLSSEQLETLGRLAEEKGKSVIVCPNFAISAILMMTFAKQAAKWMERCEIIEYHHDKKADAPSGTAIKTAELIHEAHPDMNKETLDETELIAGSRGGACHNIPIHAVRIPGVIANQEVLFGAQGQSLTLRHDTISREAFMPGLILAVKATLSRKGLTYGLEKIISTD